MPERFLCDSLFYKTLTIVVTKPFFLHSSGVYEGGLGRGLLALWEEFFFFFWEHDQWDCFVHNVAADVMMNT